MRNERGVSLIEVLVATAILVVALISLAQLFGIAIRSNIAARSTTHSTVLAQQQLEVLRSRPDLAASPSAALTENMAGFVDHIDQFGRTLDGGADTPSGAVHTRRWAIEPLRDNPDVLVIQVRVVPARASAVENRIPGEARVIALKIKDPL